MADVCAFILVLSRHRYESFVRNEALISVV